MKDTLLSSLKETEERWLAYADTAGKFLRTAPEGTVKSMLCHGKYPQFYYSEDGRTPPRKYAGIRKQRLVKQLVQRDYYEKALKYLDPALRKLQSFMKWYDPEELNRLYASLPEARKQLVTPLEPTDEMFIEEWLNDRQSGDTGYDPGDNLLTNKGERVRSKSEKIIADKLFELNIPYVYEAPLVLPGFGTIHPDFTILNVALRKTVYFEHFGLMANPSYAVSAFKKINAYAQAGLWFGDGLLYTFEYESVSINTSLLEKMIRRYLM